MILLKRAPAALHRRCHGLLLAKELLCGRQRTPNHFSANFLSCFDDAVGARRRQEIPDRNPGSVERRSALHPVALSATRPNLAPATRFPIGARIPKLRPPGANLTRINAWRPQ